MPFVLACVLCLFLICAVKHLLFLNFNSHWLQFTCLKFISLKQTFFCWCFLRELAVLNTFSHFKQIELIFSWTESIWDLRAECDLYFFSQEGQGRGLWDIWCALYLLIFANSFPQSWHLKSPSPECIRMWLISSKLYTKHLPQIVQINVLTV